MNASFSSSPAERRQLRQVVLVLGPGLDAVSGVSSHLNLLFGSELAADYSLVHFQVGSEGRAEGRIGRLLRLVASPIALAIEIHTRRAGIVHINTSLTRRAFWRDVGYSIVAKLCGAKVLCQVHGGDLPQDFSRGNSILATGLRKALALADVIVVLATVEVEAYRRFLPGRTVVAVANAVDCRPYAALTRLPSPGETSLRLVYVGRLIKEKGLYELLGGLRSVVLLGTQVELTIAGGGPEEARLRHAVDDLRLAHAVTFAGPVFGERKLELFERADVFVLPTYHPEGLPYALLEAMAAGTAVITTKVGGIPDVVTEGVHGLFVKPKDPAAIAAAIATLGADRARLARMGAACRARVAKAYSIERLAKDFSALYSHLCSSVSA